MKSNPILVKYDCDTSIHLRGQEIEEDGKKFSPLMIVGKNSDGDACFVVFEGRKIVTYFDCSKKELEDFVQMVQEQLLEKWEDLA
jgi:hypothetical protein